MIISDDILPKLVAKAKELIDKHYDDDRGIDIWDAVMINDTDGYDINVYQWDENEPIRTTAYLVKDNQIVDDYAVFQDITDEVKR
jgi:hypothetical protein